MARIHKTLTLSKGQKFLRISNTVPASPSGIVNIAVITPHSEVYDGYELLVLLELPTNVGSSTYFSLSPSTVSLLSNNISLPRSLDLGFDSVTYDRLIEFSYEYFQVSNIATPSGNTENLLQLPKLIRLMWDAKLSVWRVISVTINNELS